MEIAVIGLSYKEADVDLRGEVAFTTSMKEDATNILFEAGLSEFMILSTCNRSEIFIASNNMLEDIKNVKDLYTSMAGPKILPYLFVKKFEVALQHIYQVATGLDSLIIGEDEILGQMKRSLQFAKDQGSSKKYLNKVIREGITFSKKIRNAYKLSENQLSVASSGISYLKDKLGDLKCKKILVIGTGAMGQQVLRYLEAEKIPTIYLTNRTMNKEKVKFYIDKSMKVIDYEDRYDYLEKVDIVISATSSPHTIIEEKCCQPIQKEMIFLDMAVPRDIDNRLDEEELIDVVTLDTFSEISNEHMALRRDIALQINRLILEEVKELELWILRSKVDYVIKGFHQSQAEILKDNENQIKKMKLDANQEKAVLDMIKSSTWQMIKSPVKQLKAIKEIDDMEHYKMMIEELFDFESGDE